MNVLIKVSAIALIYIFLSIILKSGKEEYTFLLRVAAVVLIFLAVSEKIADFISNILTLFSVFNIESRHIELLLKVAGISVVTDFICDTLSDNNETSLARIVSICARLIVLILCMPMVNSIILFCVKILE